MKSIFAAALKIQTMRTLTLLRYSLLVLMLLALCCKKQSGQTQSTAANTVTTDRILYVGTYTEKEAHVEGKAAGIYMYSLDMVSGRLKYIGISPATINPSYIDVHPSGKFLYAVNETGSNQSDTAGRISAFRLMNGGISMQFINSVSSCGNYPCYIQTDHTGNYVMTANYGTGTVALSPIAADGSISNAVSVDRHTGRGHHPRQESGHAHMIATSRNNRFAYSCDLGTDLIYIYRLDTDSGRLINTGNHYNTQPGSGPRHMAFHPSAHFAYVINELNGTIECMRVDSITGSLTRFQIISTVSGADASLAACADIHITPSGRFLYASNRGFFNTIAMYSVHPLSGELTLIGHQTAKGKTPRNFVIDPTGTYLLVANQDSDNVVTFRIDQETGKLIDIGTETNIPTPVCLKFLN